MSCVSSADIPYFRLNQVYVVTPESYDCSNCPSCNHFILPMVIKNIYFTVDGGTTTSKIQITIGNHGPVTAIINSFTGSLFPYYKIRFENLPEGARAVTSNVDYAIPISIAIAFSDRPEETYQLSKTLPSSQGLTATFYYKYNFGFIF